jgi:aspartyl-tRNA(Asn)/glutamyl-tRNA(Gln) amidotransferase subunit A
LTALELGQLIRDKEISSPEATGIYLDAAKKDAGKAADDESKINAYIEIFEESALAEAAAVQKRIDAGEFLSPVAGVPMALKDCVCTKDGKTTAGSKMLENFQAPYDAFAVEKLRDAGAVVLGKTNMDEFALGTSNETSYFGAVRNPWDTGRVPGGSSGGSAAAVAAGLAPYAIGTDAGGSLRQPCSFCNLTGIKPSYGTVSHFGILTGASSLEQIGPMARDARDCAAILSIISGGDPRDGSMTMQEPFDFCDVLHGEKTDARADGETGERSSPLRGRRIGIPTNYFEMAGLSEEVKTCVLEAAETLRSLGAEFVEFEMPLIEYAMPAYLALSCAEVSSALSRFDGIRYGYR